MSSSSSSIERRYIYGETSNDSSDEDDIKRQERDSDDDDEGGGRRYEYDNDDDEPHFAAPKMRPYGNTGPKGVLQDYRDAEERMAQRIAAKRHEAQLIASKNSFTLDNASNNNADDLEAERLLAELGADADDPETALALELYRKQRLLEEYERLQAASESSRSSAVRTLGTYDYMSAVQDADPDMYVVIHVYSDAVGSCRQVGRLLEHLARERALAPRCEFCRISGRDALDSFPENVMPVVLVYRRGELVQCHMKMRSPGCLVDALKEDGVIKKTERINVPPELLKEDEFDGGYDEEEEEEDDDDDEDDY